MRQLVAGTFLTLDGVMVSSVCNGMCPSCMVMFMKLCRWCATHYRHLGRVTAYCRSALLIRSQPT